jgi:dipeptidase E
VNRDVTVIGLREATLVQVEGEKYELKGSRPMRIFRFGKEPEEVEIGGFDDLTI